jgi:hypothetical protein
VELYEQLIEQKESGQILNLNDITYDKMRKLWWEEAYPDSMLADLFEVPQKEFTKYRIY